MIIKKTLLCLSIVALMSGCNNSSDDTKSSDTKVKNVILMINDGASYGTWDMASYWSEGKLANDSSVYSDMKVRLGVSTYPLNTSNDPTYSDESLVNYDKNRAWQTSLNDEVQDKDGYEAYIKGYQYLRENYTDSAASGTAFATGVKTYNNAVGHDNHNRPLTNITQIAKQKGMSTGVVSSVQISHATPATFSAHNTTRRDMTGISIDQLTNGYVDLLMGTGHPEWDDEGNNMLLLSHENPQECNAHWACQNRFNNIDEGAWESLRKGTLYRDGIEKPNRLISDKGEFELLASGNMDLDLDAPLVGIPKVRNTLQASRSTDMGKDPRWPSGVAQLESVPSLETMTKGALNYLGAKNTGFFLMVEGGATDWAAHDHQQGHHKVNYLIEETYDFNQSVAAVKAWVEENSNWEETVLIVTTDHGNAMPMSVLSDLPDHAYEVPENFGAGNSAIDGVNVRFWSNQHTNELVRLWAKGDKASLLNNFIIDQDEGFSLHTKHNTDGSYLDNTDVFRAIKAMLD